ncbi:hypothetical protein NKL05_16975 [Mesorhizobium sp. C420B]|uniref:hypothetical protein n=1 Tax=unclassified Mesorhizobium TaxID=325217 RepID=UPI0012EC8C51
MTLVAGLAQSSFHKRVLQFDRKFGQPVRNPFLFDGRKQRSDFPVYRQIGTRADGIFP